MTSDPGRVVPSSPEALVLGVEADEARVSVHWARTRHLNLVFGQIAALTAATLMILAGVDQFGVIVLAFAFLIGIEFARRRAKRDLDQIRSVSRELDQAVRETGRSRSTDPTP
jgi:hypothetical protein